MFLFYRPHAPDCVLDANDVVTVDANTTPSAQPTTESYPEYDRIWDDGALDIVALFSRDKEPLNRYDEGAIAYQIFLDSVHTLLALPESDDEELSGTLPDGRRIAIHAKLVGPQVAHEGASFDAWFAARTPDADLILYSGHAGLGANVRALSTRGAFRPRHYVIWAVNGCDTFAYVDRTLAERRALLNPDDPSGTKYMDQVSNVLSGRFDTGVPFTMTFIEAMTNEPKSYRQIVAGIDPEQIVVVTGDEDNEFRPQPAQPPLSPSQAISSAHPARDDDDESSIRPREGGCTIQPGELPSPLAVFVMLAFARALTGTRRPHQATGVGADRRSFVPSPSCP
jgi:hypothetical protein